MRNLKLFWKFMILAILIPITITIIAGIALNKTNTLKYEYDNLYRFMLFPLLDVDKGNLHRELLKYNLREFTVPNLSPDERAVFAEAIKEQDKLMTEFIARYKSEWQTTLSPEFTVVLAGLGQQQLQIIEAEALAHFDAIYKVYAPKRDALLSGKSLDYKDIKNDLEQMSAAFESLVKVNRKFADFSNESAQNAITEMRSMLVVWGIILSLFALGIAWWLARIVTVKLADVTKENNKQDWLKTGQAQLNNLMSGGQDVMSLAKHVISFVTTYVEAQVGVFYLLSEEENKQAYLQVIASYGYTMSDNIPHKFELGEGLVGQAALEQTTLSRTHTVEESMYIVQSCMAIAVPRHVLLIPCLHENVLKGVIEIGFSNEPPTSLQQYFLEMAMQSIGIALNTAQSRTKMQVLLEQSQKQAKELQTQSEELQTQSEELRQTNDELEEQTKELERQQDDIYQKNLALQRSQIEMEKANTAIELKAKELEVASKYKSEFLANMSHELRTPLNSLLMLAQLLSDNSDGHLTDKEVKQIETIYSAGSDLLTLINEILDLSKIEAGKIEVQVEEVLLANLVDEVEEKFRHVADNKGLDFNITLADKVPSVLHTDGQRVKQIINNMLSNAFKFTSEGEIKLTITDNIANTIAISVSDTGIGVPEDQQMAIFEAFQQADGGTSRRYGGTGLGLSISRKLAQLLGGDLKLYSEEGKGSTFTLILPEKFEPSNSEMPMPETETITDDKTPALAPESSPIQHTISIADDRANLSPEDQVILIVEDDPQFLEILINITRKKNFKCIIAEDGQIGLQLAEKYLPNAILLDVGLPVMDGWTVMEKLKDNLQTRHIPVQFISGYDNAKDAKQLGAIGYLHKPVNMEQLGEAFNEIQRIIAHSLKKVLFFVDDNEQKQQFVDLIGDKEIEVIPAITKLEALKHIEMAKFDCIIIDADVEQSSGLKLLDPLYNDDKLSKIPVIVYASRELSSSEESLLQQCMDTLTIKIVRSPERLLDESTLFLHQDGTQLPKDKQEMLERIHNHETLLKDKTVLVVDDDIRNTFALTTVLEDKQMEVVIGSNGKEALSVLEENPKIDIIIMDIMMPEMDGYEAMRKIREQSSFSKLPIIALTAKAMKGDKAKCLEAGANDYLAKPVDTEKLLSLMRVWLYQ